MATNFKQPADVIEYAHGSAVDSGAAVAIGTKVGVALGSFGAGESGAYSLEGAFEVPKAGATGALDIGDAVYLNGSGEVTTVDTDTYAGIAVEAAASGATTCVIKLNF